jgi:hypothetical protein
MLRSEKRSNTARVTMCLLPRELAATVTVMDPFLAARLRTRDSAPDRKPFPACIQHACMLHREVTPGLVQGTASTDVRCRSSGVEVL